MALKLTQVMGSVALCCVAKALTKITSSADLTSKLLLALARTGYKSSQLQHYVNVTPEQEGKLIKQVIKLCTCNWRPGLGRGGW